MTSFERSRLDQYLADHRGYESRSRARDAIVRGCVQVDGKVCLKPGAIVGPGATIDIADAAANYVSRAALKLKPILDKSDVSFAGKIATDIGASTGGFTQLLLEKGVRRVHAIDSGSGQLHPSLRTDPRVNNRENLNIREIELADLDGQRPDILVCDLSFISLRTALPSIMALAADCAIGYFLVKPQFEVGREYVGKGGIVRNDRVIADTIGLVSKWFDSQPGWRVVACEAAPIAGGDGNQEYVLSAVKGRFDVR